MGAGDRTPERAVARVDLDAIERNCAHLCSLLTGGAELCAVVKADGYGHGAVESAQAAVAGGATWLAVATPAEAAELRAAGLEDARLLIMGALTNAELPTALAADADVVVWRPDFVDRLGEAARDAGKTARVHVKLDTGMGRFGTPDPPAARELANQVAAAGELELVGAMTHFATADEEGDEHFPAQLERFERFVEELRKDHPDVIAHAANSAAVYRDERAHFDLVRCGIAVYGLDPFQENPEERGLDQALSLASYVAAARPFEPGESAGYGCRWRAEEPTWIATVPIGYADGVRRKLTNNGEVLVGGRRRPIVGTISMDNITVELGTDGEAEPGEPVVLIGRQGEERILCEEMAARLDTINYEITCGLSPRVRREYLGGS